MSEKNGTPRGWEWSTIESIAQTSTGGTPSRRRSEFFGGGIPWVKSGELGDSIVIETQETLTQEGLDSSSAKLFPKGTLCIALYGATVGKLGILGMDATTNQAICGIFLPETIETRFLYYYLLSIRRDLILQGKGGAQSNISNSIVRQTRIPIAPLNEQRRIVAKLEELFSDLDAGVAALERARANLKRYRAAVLKAAVEGKLTAAWREQHPDVEPASELLKRILAERRQKWEAAEIEKRQRRGDSPGKVTKLSGYAEPAVIPESNLPKLPATWTWTTLDALTHFTVDYRGKTPPTSQTGIPIISAANVKNGRIVVNKPRFVTRQTYEKWTVRGLPRPGDLIVTTEAPVAEFALFPDDGEYLLTRRVFACQTDGIDNRYLMFCLKSATADRHIRAHLRGSTVPRILKPDLLATPIPLPPLDEQRQIANEIERQISNIHTIGSQLERDDARASRLRQCILKLAFEGKLVPHDPTDAPAGQLLGHNQREKTTKLLSRRGKS